MTQCTDTDNCIETNDLKTHLMPKSGPFFKPKVLKAMDSVTLSIKEGHTVELARESGCGKTTIGRITLKLYQTTARRILYQGTGIIGLSDSQMVPYRKKMQMIFQDPYIFLDPRKNIGDIIVKSIWAMKLHMRKDKNDRVRKLIEMVGLKPDHINRHPHEFSGGQKQGIDIARASVAEPEFIVCDEPVSALSASIQAQVTSILEELQDRFRFTCLFISRDSFMIRHISSEVGVMYLGNFTRYIQADELYDNMPHPYTQSLIPVMPVVNPELVKENQRIILEGDAPSPTNPAPGCPFRSRYRYTRDTCGQVKSELRAINDKHKMVCHLFDQPDGAGLTRAESQGQNHGYKITDIESRIQNHMMISVTGYSVGWALMVHITLRGRKTFAGCSQEGGVK